MTLHLTVSPSSGLSLKWSNVSHTLDHFLLLFLSFCGLTEHVVGGPMVVSVSFSLVSTSSSLKDSYCWKNHKTRQLNTKWIQDSNNELNIKSKQNPNRRSRYTSIDIRIYKYRYLMNSRFERIEQNKNMRIVQNKYRIELHSLSDHLKLVALRPLSQSNRNSEDAKRGRGATVALLTSNF